MAKSPLVENTQHGCQCGDTFLTGNFPEVKVLRQPQSLGQETRPPENYNLNITIIPSFSSPLAYHPLPRITMSWAKILDRPVQFSTIV